MKSVFMSLELDGDTVLDGNVVSQCKMNGEAITTLTRCFDKHGRQGDCNGSGSDPSHPLILHIWSRY